MSGDSEAARRYNTMTDKEWQQGYFDGETPPESETSDTSSSDDTHPSQPPTDSSHHDSSSNDSDSDEQASLDEDDKILIGDRFTEERKVVVIGSLLLDRPLSFHHPVGTAVQRVGRRNGSTASGPEQHYIHSDTSSGASDGEV